MKLTISNRQLRERKRETERDRDDRQTVNHRNMFFSSLQLNAVETCLKI